MIRMIFCDMDGTLLDEKGDLPAEFDDLAQSLIARDVLFVPSSGRQYYSLLDTFPAYRDDFPFLAENGTAVWYKGERIFSSPIDQKLVKEVLSTAATIPACRSVYCGYNYGYVQEEQHEEIFMTELHTYYSRTKSTPSFDALEDPAVKLSFFDPEAKAETRILPVLKKFRDRLQVVLASEYWVDVMNPDINKGAAATALREKFGLKFDECACFGDYMNDAEMMGAVYYSCAMENAYPEVKKLARFSAPSNAEHGVIKKIRGWMKEGLI